MAEGVDPIYRHRLDMVAVEIITDAGPPAITLNLEHESLVGVGNLLDYPTDADTVLRVIVEAYIVTRTQEHSGGQVGDSPQVLVKEKELGPMRLLGVLIFAVVVSVAFGSADGTGDTKLWIVVPESIMVYLNESLMAVGTEPGDGDFGDAVGGLQRNVIACVVNYFRILHVGFLVLWILCRV